MAGMGKKPTRMCHHAKYRKTKMPQRGDGCKVGNVCALSEDPGCEPAEKSWLAEIFAQ